MVIENKLKNVDFQNIQEEEETKNCGISSAEENFRYYLARRYISAFEVQNWLDFFAR